MLFPPIFYSYSYSHFFSFSSSGILQSSGTNWKTKLWFDLKGESSAACGFYQVSFVCFAKLTKKERKNYKSLKVIIFRVKESKYLK